MTAYRGPMPRRRRTVRIAALLVTAAVAVLIVSGAGPGSDGPQARAATLDASDHTFISGVTGPMSFTSFECTFAVPELPRQYAPPVDLPVVRHPADQREQPRRCRSACSSRS